MAERVYVAGSAEEEIARLHRINRYQAGEWKKMHERTLVLEKALRAALNGDRDEAVRVADIDG